MLWPSGGRSAFHVVDMERESGRRRVPPFVRRMPVDGDNVGGEQPEQRPAAETGPGTRPVFPPEDSDDMEMMDYAEEGQPRKRQRIRCGKLSEGESHSTATAIASGLVPERKKKHFYLTCEPCDFQACARA